MKRENNGIWERQVDGVKTVRHTLLGTRLFYGLSVLLLGFVCLCEAQQPTPARPAAPKAKKPTAVATPKQNQSPVSFFRKGGFVTALAQDASGGIWVGMEEGGVFRCARQADGTWTNTRFTTKDGLGDDNAYAIACDKLGRVWVGHLNHGVSVFNGQTCKNYDVTKGPLGERVFCMAVCPLDGDVWMGTSAGIARYSEEINSKSQASNPKETPSSNVQTTGTWLYYTRAEGLPSDQVSAIAFDRWGNVIVGTQCDGVAVAIQRDGYGKWYRMPGTEKMPLDATGKGMPSNLINDVLVGSNGTIWVATTTGLAWTENGWGEWRFLRGKDYAEKVKGLWGGAPKDWKPAEKTVMDALLPEDYVTRLAEDGAGNIWVGMREKGYAVLNPLTRQMVQQGTKKTVEIPDDYVSVLLGTREGMYVGTYGGGLGFQGSGVATVVSTADSSVTTTRRFTEAPLQRPPFPAVAKTATAEELARMTAAVTALLTNQLVAAYLGEDWSTQGDWVGRHGRQYAMLCAAAAPWNHPFQSGDGYDVCGQIGPGFVKTDALRHWIHWLKTDNPRVLYSPLIGCRREAEWDDHGEVYQPFREGPDIWVTVIVPEGMHRVSVYFFNPNGHEGKNRFRDYVVDLKPYVEKSVDDPRQRKGISNDTGGPLEDLEAADKLATLAHARVRDFCGGVYKQFLVHGSGKYLIKISRNHSLNTLCNGIMIDRMSGIPPEKDPEPMDGMIRTLYRPPVVEVPRSLVSTRLQAAMELWDRVSQNVETSGISTVLYPFRMAAFRTALAEKAPSYLLENWRWKLLLWQAEDREEFQRKIKQGWHELLLQNPHLRESGYKE